MADISDAFAASAAFALGKASGQDFLGPMLADTRQKDLFIFQQKQAEAAIEKERKRRREEGIKSKKGLLAAYQAAGAISQEDLVGAGGIDAFAEMDDDDFHLGIAAITENRAKNLADADLFAATRGMAAAMNVAIPEGGIKTREQAIELQSRMTTQRLMEQDGKAQRAEIKSDFGQRVTAVNEQVQSVDPLAATPKDVQDLNGMILQAEAAVNSNITDLGEDRNTLLTRLGSARRMLGRLAVHAAANERDLMYTEKPELFFEDYKAADLTTRAALIARPNASAVMATLENNLKALRVMTAEGAAIGKVDAAWGAAQGKDSVEVLLANPEAAAAVYRADVRDAAMRQQQQFARSQAEAEAESERAAFEGEFAVMGIPPPDVDAKNFIVAIEGPNGLTTSFDKARYLKATAEALAKQDLTLEQSFLVSRSDKASTPLRTVAREKSIEMLRTPEAMAALDKAQERTDTRFTESLDAFISSIETPTLTPQREGYTETAPSFTRPLTGGEFLNRSLPRAESADRTVNLAVFKEILDKGAATWKIRDLSVEAEQAYQQAKQEKELAEGTPLEGATLNNLTAAEEARVAYRFRSDVRRDVIQAVIGGVSGESSGNALEKGAEGLSELLGVTDLPVSAGELVKTLKQKLRPELLVTNRTDTGTELDPVTLGRSLDSEIADMTMIAEAIDAALADKARAEVMFKWLGRAGKRPEWVDEPEKMAAYLFLRTADEAGK